MQLREALGFSAQALRANPVRSLLTGLGMAIGTASVILVVTISLTSRDYILEQIEGIGSNIIFGYYVSAGPTSVAADADYIKMADIDAIRSSLSADIVAATGVMSGFDQILIQGKPHDVKVIGTDSDYAAVRNIVIPYGRFFGAEEVSERQKVALLTDPLAERMFGSREGAINQPVRLYGLPFVVIGTFREKVSTFGQSEWSAKRHDPETVLKYSRRLNESIRCTYRRAPGRCEAVDQGVQAVLESRHRPGARYGVAISDVDSGGREGHRQCLNIAVDYGVGHRPGDFRNRHHEHYAGDGDGADARNRVANGRRGGAQGRPGTISGGGGVDQHGRGVDGDSGGDCGSAIGDVVCGRQYSDFTGGNRGGFRGVVRGGAGVWIPAGESGGAFESDGGVAVRVVGASGPRGGTRMTLWRLFAMSTGRMGMRGSAISKSSRTT